MAAREIWSKTDLQMVEYLQSAGLLKKTEECPNCGHRLKLKENKQRKILVYKCSGCKSGVSMRRGSIFNGSTLSLKELTVLTSSFLQYIKGGPASMATGVGEKAAIR